MPLPITKIVLLLIDMGDFSTCMPAEEMRATIKTSKAKPDKMPAMNVPIADAKILLRNSFMVRKRCG
jgi:hypothetical protein